MGEEWGGGSLEDEGVFWYFFGFETGWWWWWGGRGGGGAGADPDGKEVVLNGDGAWPAPHGAFWQPWLLTLSYNHCSESQKGQGTGHS